MKTSYNGIDALRYSARDDFLKNMPSCFCINKIKGALTQDAPGREGCLLSGALDLTECLGENGLKDFNEWILIFDFYRRSNCWYNATFPWS